MSLRISKAYFLVPPLYVALIIGLLILQFAGGERTTRSVGQLVLQATRSAVSQEGGPSVRSLDLEFGGLRLPFTENSSVTLVSAIESRDLGVLSYEQTENGFLVNLEEGFVLSARTSTDPVRELQLVLLSPENLDATYDRIELPFSLKSGASVGELGSSTFLSIETAERDYYLTVPPNAFIDREQQRIVLEPSATGDAIRYVEAATGDPTRVTAWFQEPGVQMSQRDIDLVLGSFVDAAYLGWSSGRYDPPTLTWEAPGTGRQFSEAALTAYLAEAWNRGDYQRAFTEMRRAIDLHPEQLSLLSSAFLGNLDTIQRETLAADRERVQALSAQIVRRDPSIFETTDLFQFAAARGSEDLYASLLEFAQSVQVPTLDVASAVGLLANISIAEWPDDRMQSLARELGGPLYRLLLASIVRTPEGFFLQTSPGQINLYQSLLAGRALEQLGVQGLGAVADNPLAIIVGRNLMASALALAGPYGTLPASLIIRGEGIEASTSRFAPERIYPHLTSNRAYPQMTSFYAELGSGHWSWTVVPLDTVELEDEQWRFVMEYPRLRTHYVMFFGVPSFDRMTLFGQTWRDAPDFEIYSKGRHYDEETDTLMIKYYDDSVRREIILIF
ncbi:MAG: hypothetical protein ACOC8L_09780 [Spirochaetota bacterium]